MSLSVRIPSISQDIEVIIAETLSPEARSSYLADFAREALAEAQETNRRALGRVPAHESFVDGRPSDAFETVRPDGVIAITFELVDEVLEWIGEQLVLSSPVLTGAYARSHMLFVDGVDMTHQGASGQEYTFVSTLPYARKIERGQSDQAPDGVYQAIAAVAARRFGNMARIQFTYRAVITGQVVNQDLAASSGIGQGIGARAATGEFEKTLNPLAHNKSNVRYPCIVVTL